MAPPSQVPSAVALAQGCATAYEQQSGEVLHPDCHRSIELLADHFAQRGQLEGIFLGRVIRAAGLAPFVRGPNLGHEALGDFLACGAIELNISTNVDVLTEMAAESIGEPLSGVAVTRAEAVTGTQPHRPHVKLHGCFRRSIPETLWCLEQLSRLPFDQRIHDFTQWLPNALLGRDLVFVGFWSDWAYLNQVLEAVVGQAMPNLVVLVNPSNHLDLRAKAAGLWDLAHREPTEFVHAQQSGADFLDELRRGFSVRFMKRMLNSSTPFFQAEFGHVPRSFPAFEGLTGPSLYQWRRDSTCTPPELVVRQKEPDSSMHRLGVMHLELHEAGARIEEDAYLHLGKRVRLVQGAGRYLSDVQNDFTHTSAVNGADDIVICVGAQDTSPLPLDIIRDPGNVNVANRGGSGVWLTDDAARDLFATLAPDPVPPAEPAV